MKRILSCLLALVLLGTLSLTAAAYEPTGVDVCAEAVILADPANDVIVYEKNADTPRSPASLTKIMTAVCVLEMCSDLDNTSVTITADALDPLEGTDSSVFYLGEGEVMSAKDLLAVLMIASANDAANALAYHFGDNSIDAFITKMNEKAAALGMTNTHFVNAHGLDDPSHYTTARDMYTLTRYAMQIPLFAEIVSTVEYTVDGTNYRYGDLATTTVHLQNPVSEYYYPYAKGVKTGYTDPAGRCLVTTAQKDGNSYICVLLGCPVYDDEGYLVRREFGLSSSLYDWAFDTFEYRTLADVNTIAATCPVDLGEGAESVDGVLGAAVATLVERTTPTDAVTVDVALTQEMLTAPVTKGTVIGTATVSLNGNAVGTVDVLANADIALSEKKVKQRQIENFFARPLVRVLVWVLGILLVLLVLFILYSLWRAHKRRVARRRRKQRMQQRGM